MFIQGPTFLAVSLCPSKNPQSLEISITPISLILAIFYAQAKTYTTPTEHEKVFFVDLKSIDRFAVAVLYIG